MSSHQDQFFRNIFGDDIEDSIPADNGLEDEHLFGDEYYEVEDPIPLENSVLDEGVVVEDSNSSENALEDEDYHVEDSFPDTVGDAQIPSSDPTDMTLEKNMEFSSLDELFDYYQDYARCKGFAVIKRNAGSSKYGCMACDRGRKIDDPKTSKKIDCKAHINYKIKDDGSCVVTSVFHQHNHDIDPSFSVLMPAHRRLTVHMKRQLDANDIAGLRPSKSIRICEVQCGGPQNLGCTAKDCRNYIDERRRLRLGDGDAEAIRKMFARLQLEDPKFFYLMDIGPDSRLRNILWIHPRSRAAYQEFNDVVSFDTTYLVNRYQMPFGSIVGVNHHGHSILLGCALLSKEDADTFRWLFTNWLEAMGDVHPNCIITDQCEGIKKAIKDVMPYTRHRYCIWHILSKLPTKFGGLRANYSKCAAEFKGIIYDSLDIQTFESKWGAFLVKYGYENNEWLRELHRERENWVPVFLHHVFWAGMMSTQRSEGMHSFFDGYIHSRSTLKQFVEQYDIAIAYKTHKEFQADYDSKTKQIKCKTTFGWERQFQNEYTNSMFRLVQKQIDLMHYCHVVAPTDQDVNSSAGVERFMVMERRNMTNHYSRELIYSVDWRPAGSYISCNCRKFEFKGILCCHIMKVLAQENIDAVHERYLMDRWKKTVIRPHSKIFFKGGYPHMTEEYKKYQEVEKGFQQCIDIAMSNSDQLFYVNEKISELKDRLLNWGEEEGPSEAHNNANSGDGGQPLLNPHVASTKGRPKENRRVPTSEVIINRRKPGRPKGSKNRNRQDNTLQSDLSRVF